MRSIPLLLVSGALALTMACASGGGGNNPVATNATGTATATVAATATAVAKAAASNAITIATFKFQPTPLEVAPGTTVTWINQDAILHTATAGTPDKKTGTFDGQLADAGTKFEHRFEQAGRFAVFCDRHQFMTGEVVVR